MSRLVWKGFLKLAWLLKQLGSEIRFGFEIRKVELKPDLLYCFSAH